MFLLAWWDHLPLILQALQPAWERDRKFLQPVLWAGTLRFLWDAFRSLSLVAAIQAVCWLAGRRVFGWILRGGAVDGLWHVLFALGLGHGLLATLTAGLGFLGLLQPGVMWCVLCAPVFGAGGWRNCRARPQPTPGAASPPEELPEAPGPGNVVARAARWACAAVAMAGVAGLLVALVDLLNGHPGRFGLFNRTPPEAVPVFAAACAVAVAAVALVAWLGRLLPRSQAWPVWLLAGACAFFAVAQLLLACTPEWFYDSLVYHMAVPEQYLVVHKICYLGHTFISNYPFLQEMRYLFCMALGDDVAPKLTHWADGLLVAAAAYALARPHAGRLGGWLAATLMLSAPTLRFLQTVTMVELGLAWFVALAAMALISGQTDRRRGARTPWLFLLGCYLGMAHGVKYIGVNASILMLGWLAVADRRVGRPWRTVWTRQAVVVGAASLWTGVWLWKNWGFTGNPLFPFLHQVFPSLHWDASRQHLWMFDNTKYGIVRGAWLNWLGLPVMVSTESDVFGTFTFNPFPLLLVPLLFFVRTPPAAMTFLGGFAGLFALGWSLSSQQVRFLLPMLPEAAAVAAFVVVRLGETHWLVRAQLAAATAWIVFMSMWGTVLNRTTSTVLVPFMAGHWDREGILRAALPYYSALQEANRRMGAHDRLLFVGGDESLYGARPRICDSIYDFSTVGRLAARSANAADLAARLRRLRVTHLLVHERRAEEYAAYGLFDWNERARRNFLELWSGWLRPVISSKGMQLFALARRPVAPELRKTGIPCFVYPTATVQQAGSLVVIINGLLVQGKWAEALPRADELVRAVPRAAHAWAYRGLILGQTGHPAEAMRDYAEAVRLGYPSGDAYFNLGRFQSQRRMYREALDNFMLAAEIEPGIAQLGRETALEVALYLKRYPTALELARALHVANPAEPRYRNEVSRIEKLVRR